MAQIVAALGKKVEGFIARLNDSRSDVLKQNGISMTGEYDRNPVMQATVNGGVAVRYGFVIADANRAEVCDRTSGFMKPEFFDALSLWMGSLGLATTDAGGGHKFLHVPFDRLDVTVTEPEAVAASVAIAAPEVSGIDVGGGELGEIVGGARAAVLG